MNGTVTRVHTSRTSTPSPPVSQSRPKPRIPDELSPERYEARKKYYSDKGWVTEGTGTYRPRRVKKTGSGVVVEELGTYTYHRGSRTILNKPYVKSRKVYDTAGRLVREESYSLGRVNGDRQEVRLDKKINYKTGSVQDERLSRARSAYKESRVKIAEENTSVTPTSRAKERARERLAQRAYEARWDRERARRAESRLELRSAVGVLHPSTRAADVLGSGDSIIIPQKQVYFDPIGIPPELRRQPKADIKIDVKPATFQRPAPYSMEYLERNKPRGQNVIERVKPYLKKAEAVYESKPARILYPAGLRQSEYALGREYLLKGAGKLDEAYSKLPASAARSVPGRGMRGREVKEYTPGRQALGARTTTEFALPTTVYQLGAELAAGELAGRGVIKGVRAYRTWRTAPPLPKDVKIGVGQKKVIQYVDDPSKSVELVEFDIAAMVGKEKFGGRVVSKSLVTQKETGEVYTINQLVRGGRVKSTRPIPEFESVFKGAGRSKDQELLTLGVQKQTLGGKEEKFVGYVAKNEEVDFAGKTLGIQKGAGFDIELVKDIGVVKRGNVYDIKTSALQPRPRETSVLISGARREIGTEAQLITEFDLVGIQEKVRPIRNVQYSKKLKSPKPKLSRTNVFSGTSILQSRKAQLSLRMGVQEEFGKLAYKSYLRQPKPITKGLTKAKAVTLSKQAPRLSSRRLSGFKSGSVVIPSIIVRGDTRVGAANKLLVRGKARTIAKNSQRNISRNLPRTDNRFIQRSMSRSMPRQVSRSIPRSQQRTPHKPTRYVFDVPLLSSSFRPPGKLDWPDRYKYERASKRGGFGGFERFYKFGGLKL